MAGGVEGIPLETRVNVLAPFVVVGIVDGEESPEELAKCETRSTFHHHVRLPRELVSIIDTLPEDQRGPARFALQDALLDADIPIRGVRMDAVVAVGHDYWALTTPQTQSLAKDLSIAFAVWQTGGLTPAIATAFTQAIWQTVVCWRTRTKLSPDQALVLRVLKHAPKGEGWKLEELVEHLPANTELTALEVESIIVELRGLLDTTGDAITWKVHDRNGRFWSSGV